MIDKSIRIITRFSPALSYYSPGQGTFWLSCNYIPDQVTLEGEPLPERLVVLNDVGRFVRIIDRDGKTIKTLTFPSALGSGMGMDENYIYIPNSENIFRLNKKTYELESKPYLYSERYFTFVTIAGNYLITAHPEDTENNIELWDTSQPPPPARPHHFRTCKPTARGRPERRSSGRG